MCKEPGFKQRDYVLICVSVHMFLCAYMFKGVCVCCHAHEGQRTNLRAISLEPVYFISLRHVSH